MPSAYPHLESDQHGLADPNGGQAHRPPHDGPRCPTCSTPALRRVKTWADCTLREKAALLLVPPFLTVREDLDVMALMDHGPFIAVVQADTVDRAIVRASYLLAWNVEPTTSRAMLGAALVPRDWEPVGVIVGLLQEWDDRQREQDPWHQVTWTRQQGSEAMTRRLLVMTQTGFWRSERAWAAARTMLRPVHDVVQSL